MHKNKGIDTMSRQQRENNSGSRIKTKKCNLKRVNKRLKKEKERKHGFGVQ